MGNSNSINRTGNESIDTKNDPHQILVSQTSLMKNNAHLGDICDRRTYMQFWGNDASSEFYDEHDVLTKNPESEVMFDVILLNNGKKEKYKVHSTLNRDHECGPNCFCLHDSKVEKITPTTFAPSGISSLSNVSKMNGEFTTYRLSNTKSMYGGEGADDSPSDSPSESPKIRNRNKTEEEEEEEDENIDMDDLDNITDDITEDGFTLNSEPEFNTSELERMHTRVFKTDTEDYFDDDNLDDIVAEAMDTLKGRYAGRNNRFDSSEQDILDMTSTYTMRNRSAGMKKNPKYNY